MTSDPNASGTHLPPPPDAYRHFVERFPLLGQAWNLIGTAGSQGPLDLRTARLVKLAIAMGAGREGAVHAGVRKALAAGVSPEEIEHLVALAAGTLGMPTCVALHRWVRDVLDQNPS